MCMQYVHVITTLVERCALRSINVCMYFYSYVVYICIAVLLLICVCFWRAPGPNGVCKPSSCLSQGTKTGSLFTNCVVCPVLEGGRASIANIP